MTERRNAAPIIVRTLAALLLLFGAYMGSYYVMLSGQATVYRFGDDSYEDFVWPDFRIDHPLIDKFFIPAMAVDRLVRPHRWQTDYWK